MFLRKIDELQLSYYTTICILTTENIERKKIYF